MALPSTVRAGDTLQWIEPPGVDAGGDVADSASWTLTVYFRKGAAADTATGTARTDGGWDLELTATETGALAAGRWDWQSLAVNGSESITLRSGSITVLQSLAYTGTPATFDGRSQAETDLEQVQAAIRALMVRGAQQYSIGSRSFTALQLPQLIQRESQLKAIVAREKAAARVAAGLGDPRNLFVRFN
jgi:hypothetical protein